MMSKRAVLVLFAFQFSVTWIFAGGEQEKPTAAKEKVELDFWYTPWDPDPEAREEYFTRMFDAFEAETGAKVSMLMGYPGVIFP